MTLRKKIVPVHLEGEPLDRRRQIAHVRDDGLEHPARPRLGGGPHDVLRPDSFGGV